MGPARDGPIRGLGLRFAAWSFFGMQDDAGAAGRAFMWSGIHAGCLAFHAGRDGHGLGICIHLAVPVGINGSALLVCFRSAAAVPGLSAPAGIARACRLPWVPAVGLGWDGTGMRGGPRDAAYRRHGCMLARNRA